MDKLERRLARLWRRMRGEKRRERRSKTKGESSPQSNRGEVTSNNQKQRHENVTKEQKDVVATTLRRTHSKHNEEKDLSSFKSPRRSHSKNLHDERDVKSSLRRNHSKHEDRDAGNVLIRRNHSKHSEKDLLNSQNQNHRAEKDLSTKHDPSKQQKTVALNQTQCQSPQDVSRALIRLYAFARLKSLQKAIVAGGSPSSGRSITVKHDDFESFKPLERNSFLSSLPQLSLNRLESRDFDKTCLSHDSGYLTGSPRDFSSSTETLRQKSPSVRSPRKREENEALAYKRRFHASHGDILSTTGAISSSTQKLDTIESFLSRNVYKSKCVTSLFEAAHAGLEALIDDVLAEFNRWFVGRKMLVVASELHFSVPLAKRSRKLEQIMKQQMLRSLLENNRRILYLRGKGEVLPLHMAEARTEENIYNDLKLQAVQGVYQRCYYKLLPFVHSATPSWHAPYWKLSEPPVVPKKSAFQLDDHSKLRTHSFISFNIIGLSVFGIGHQSQDLVVTAWSVFDTTKNASRVLRIELEDVDDNIPQFNKGAKPVFVAPYSSSSRSNVVIGKVFAEDKDGQGLNAVHYYLLPRCTTDYDSFSVDDYSGEIAVTAAATRPSRAELCILASNYADLNVVEVEFDSKNASMVKAAVIFEGEQSSTAAPAPFVKNDTVTLIEENLQNTPIAVTQSNPIRDVRFVLDHVDFKPTQDSSDVLHSSTNSLFFVEPVSGDVRINPVISEQPQGVYDVFVNVLSGASKNLLEQFVKKYHYVKDDMKMRYVFNMTSEEFAKNRGEFEKKAKAALSKDHPEGNMELFFSQPKRDKRSPGWTSVCFHATMNSQVLGERAIMSAISQSSVENGQLSSIYHVYRVINIEHCEPTSPQVRHSALTLPAHVVILVAGVAILILILITLLTYICFVRRYKEHLRAKQKQFKEAENICTFDPSPTFILPPAPPQFGYY